MPDHEAPPARACMPIALAPGPEGLAMLLAALRAALAGTGPAVAPLPANCPADLRDRLLLALRPGEPVPGPVAAVLATSGSTAAPRGVLLPASAITSAVNALAVGVGRSPGGHRWVAALPLHSAGGFMVAARGVLADVPPVPTPSLGAGRFTVADLAAATSEAERRSRVDGRPLATSLVPAMLARAVAAGADGIEVLTRYDLVLVGGAATDPGLLSVLRSAGIAVRTSYGMTETCGGAVLDGVPLPGVRVGTDADGRLLIAGPQVALGYRGDDPAGDFTIGVDGQREFRTGDLGEMVEGVVRVTGRIDDIVQVGGTSVALAAVRGVLLADSEVADAEVVALPDPVRGVELVALVVRRPGGEAAGPIGHRIGTDDSDTPAAAQILSAGFAARLQSSVTASLGRPARPRRVLTVAAIPLLSTGKPDRQLLLGMAGQTDPATAASSPGPADRDAVRPARS